MFRILVDNEVIGVCETPRYIKKKNNIWVRCQKSDAEGIAINNQVYATAVAVPVDNGEYVFQIQKELQEVQDIRITDIENALCELTIEV